MDVIENPHTGILNRKFKVVLRVTVRVKVRITVAGRIRFRFRVG